MHIQVSSLGIIPPKIDFKHSFLLTVGEEYGFAFFEKTLCLDNTNFLASHSHGTPYDCLQLCESTENCDAFVTFAYDNACSLYTSCNGTMTHFNFDSYLRLGMIIDILVF